MVETEIPDSDITDLERLLLSTIFEAERYNGITYFFSEVGPSDMIYLSRSELTAALAASEAIASAANAFGKDLLAKTKEEAGDEIEIDLSDQLDGWAFLFQDIVRRSATLPYVIVTAAYTCSKMRSDGFGGSAMLITADEVMAKSTVDLIEEFETKAKASPSKKGGQ